MKKVAIERKRDLTSADFVRDHLQGVGRPVVVTDAMDFWPARSKWTFDFFKETYGSDFATAPLGLFSKAAKLTSVATYIDHLDTPNEDMPGFWVGSDDGKPTRTAPTFQESPPYLLGWNAFQKHPELYEDIRPAPYFVSDWVLTLDPKLRELLESISGREFWSVYVGPEGSLSRLHCDFWNTHACLAQVQGKKKAILFSPEDLPFLYGGEVDPELPDAERFEQFRHATAYECVLEPGDLLFIPGNWWHCVRTLEKSITVSHNFFNERNFNNYLAGVLSRLPRLTEILEKNPDWRQGIDQFLH